MQCEKLFEVIDSLSDRYLDFLEDVCNIDIGNIGDAERREDRAREAARRGTVNVPAEELAKYEAILAEVKKGKVIY